MPSASEISTSKAAVIRQLLAKRAQQHRIIKENTEKLAPLEEQFSTRPGKKPKEYHVLKRNILAAENILKGVNETVIDELVMTDAGAASAAASHAEVHVRHAAPAGRSAAARAQDAAEDAAVVAEAAAVATAEEGDDDDVDGDDDGDDLKASLRAEREALCRRVKDARVIPVSRTQFATMSNSGCSASTTTKSMLFAASTSRYAVRYGTWNTMCPSCRNSLNRTA